MKLDVKHLKSEVEKILRQEAMSPEELANKSSLSRATIYAILNLEKPTSYLSTGRKIAEGAKRIFRIEGDKIYFGQPRS